MKIRNILTVLLIGVFLINIVSADYKFENTTGTELMHLYSNGGNLSVLGNISASNFFGDGSGLSNINTSSLNLSGINYWLKNNNDLYYNSGNVGIGTITPQNKLNVIGDGNFTGTGFFDWLGSLSKRITGLFVINADISNNLTVGGDVNVAGDVNVEGFVYSKICPVDMSYIDKVGGYCIDKYEASMPGATSLVMGTSGEIVNRNNPGTMKAESKAGVVPWVRVSQTSARTACENAGKNLCSDAEWLGAANVQGQTYYLPTSLNVAPYYCVVSSSTYCIDNSYENGEACDTGTYSGGASGCYSEEGVYDMTGNVWEWTDEVVDVINPDGVAGWKYANAEGNWQTSTSGLWNKYGNDGVYFPTSTTARAVRRGGTWNYGALAGPFSAALNDAPTYTHYNLGFRCCSASS